MSGCRSTCSSKVSSINKRLVSSVLPTVDVPRCRTCQTRALFVGAHPHLVRMLLVVLSLSQVSPCQALRPDHLAHLGAQVTFGCEEGVAKIVVMTICTNKVLKACSEVHSNEVHSNHHRSKS